ncbi:MAG: AAA family ATPase [Geminicoccaceae bacterium]
MEFSRLRVSGFKSFCDPVELEIGSGLTGIVGPNGCGKSNIVEALRWVMGESSAKGLRGSEMNDVIFAGSSLRSAYDMAEVSLLVKKPASRHGANGSNGHAAVANGHGPNGSGERGLAEAGVAFDLEELEIARRISRGSGSAYRLNGREARARDIHLVFADVGAGARSPAIIGQGQVGFVVEAKPEERRRLLEDAAGIGGLHSRRREAELKLAATERNLERVTDRIADQDERLTDLRRQAKQAERYRKLQEQIRELEALTTLARLKEAREALEKAEQRLERTRRAHGEAASAQVAAEKARIDAEALLPERREAVALTTALAARAEERLVTVEASHSQHERERRMLEEQVAEAKERLDRLEREAALAEASLVDRDRESEEAGSRIETLEASLAELREVEPELADTVATASERARLIEREIAVAEARRESLANRLSELQARRETVREELERLVSVDDDALVEVARRQLVEAEAEHRSAGEAQARASDEAGHFAGQRDDLDEKVEVCRERLAEATHARQTLEAEIAAGRQRHEAQKAQGERLVREEDRIRRRMDAIETERKALDLDRKRATRAELAPRCEALAAEVRELHAREAELAARREDASARREADLAASADFERRLDRAVAEEEALRSLQTGDDNVPIIDHVEIPEAWSRALAAALGDDLLLSAEDDRTSTERVSGAGSMGNMRCSTCRRASSPCRRGSRRPNA